MIKAKRSLAVLLILISSFVLTACGFSDLFKKQLIFEDVIFSSATYEYDGSVKRIEATGIPEGANVVYKNNEGIEIGVYKAKVTITKKGYKKLVMNAVLTIIKSSAPV